MNGVMFNDLHSYRNLSLILSDKEIGDAKPKLNLLEIEGADEPLDFTEFFGDIKYKNRKLQFEFTYIGQNPLTVYSDIQNKLNGKRMKIVLDEDSQFYYLGRVSVNKWKSDKRIGKVVIECDCNPFKYKLNKTRMNFSVNSSKLIQIPNLRKWVTPEFAFTNTMQIDYRGKTYSAGPGVFRTPEIVLQEGNNDFTFRGTGTVTMEYQEGGL